MMFRFGLLWLIYSLSGCAGHPPAPSAMPSDKDFQVPPSIAKEFEESDMAQEGVTPPTVAPATPPQAPPVTAATSPPAAPEKKAAHRPQKKAAKAKKMRTPKKSKKMPTAAQVEEDKAKMAAPLDVPNRWTMTPFFRQGERVVFDITYFGATAGQLELTVLPEKVVANRSTYHFRAVASSTSVFSLFYRVNDVAESFVDTTGLFSHKFSLKLDESRQTRDVLELYDQDKRKAYYWSKWDMAGKPRQNDQSEIDLVPFTQDGLSSFFFVRTLPLEIGKKYEFPVVNNGKLRTVRVTALRKETLVTRMGEYNAIVVKPEVVLDGVLQSFGDSFMWISDDADRQILKIDAKIKVGSVIAYLRDRTTSPGVKSGAP